MSSEINSVLDQLCNLRQVKTLFIFPILSSTNKVNKNVIQECRKDQINPK